MVSAFKVFPIEATHPVFNRFNHQYGYIKMLCVNGLSKRKKKDLIFLTTNYSLEFVTPNNPEFSRYKDIADNFQSYFDYYYHPAEERISDFSEMS